MTHDVSFDLTDAYQTKVLALAIREEDFLKKFASIIKGAHFENALEAMICSVCLSYYDTYRTRPTIDAVWEFLRQLEGDRLDDEKEALYSDKLDEIKFIDISDSAYVTDRVLDFVRIQSMKIAVLESAEILHRRDVGYLSTIMSKIDAASKVTAGIEDIGLNYFPTLQERLTSTQDRYKEVKTPTLIRSLDHAMGGGLGNGELGIIMAATNRGKSMFLTILGKSAIFLGKRVVHYSLEMSDLKIAQRYDTCFTGKDKDAIRNTPEETVETLSAIGKRYSNSLIIKKYPTGTASVANLRSHLHQLDALGLTPDIVIVDYGDIMRSSRNYNNEYTAQGEIFADLRGIASERNICLWSATQANKGATNKRVIDISDVSDSFEKIRVADVVLTMCQTEDEQRLGQMRLFVAKNRDGICFQTIDVAVDWSRVHMVEATDSRLGDSAL